MSLGMDLFEESKKIKNIILGIIGNFRSLKLNPPDEYVFPDVKNYIDNFCLLSLCENEYPVVLYFRDIFINPEEKSVKMHELCIVTSLMSIYTYNLNTGEFSYCKSKLKSAISDMDIKLLKTMLRMVVKSEKNRFMEIDLYGKIVDPNVNNIRLFNYIENKNV